MRKKLALFDNVFFFFFFFLGGGGGGGGGVFELKVFCVWVVC
jgi:hypothetical protein